MCCAGVSVFAITQAAACKCVHGCNDGMPSMHTDNIHTHVGTRAQRTATMPLYNLIGYVCFDSIQMVRVFTTNLRTGLFVAR